VTRWVLASSNAGKLREFSNGLSELLARDAIELVNQGDLGIAPAEEPFATFEENALVKARHASCASGCAAIADDSGLCVDALGGAPGVRSARYWQDQRSLCADAQRAQLDALGTDEANWRFLVSQLTAPSAAQFRCVIAFVRNADDPAPIVVQGVWSGQITGDARGVGGFGYDPIFFVPELGKMAAELTLEEKHRFSHRGHALRAFIQAVSAHR
jgi:XTP/dITP diphosphohydrolase